MLANNLVFDTIPPFFNFFLTTLIYLLIKVQIISNVTNPIPTPSEIEKNNFTGQVNRDRTNKLVMETTMQGFYETNAVFYTFIYFYNLLHCKEMLTNMIRRLDCRM